MKISTQFNQKYLRAKHDVKFGSSFEDLFEADCYKGDTNIFKKDQEVTILSSLKVENIWYHKVRAKTGECGWVRNEDFHNVPDPIVYAHITIDVGQAIYDGNFKVLGYVTVATTRKPIKVIDDKEEFAYGFSFCSPSDSHKFSKKYGREKSKIELNANKFQMRSIVNKDKSQSTYDRCLHALAEYLSFNKSKIPWLKDVDLIVEDIEDKAMLQYGPPSTLESP